MIIRFFVQLFPISFFEICYQWRKSTLLKPKLVFNQPPIANAGQPKTVKSGDIVTLDGGGSYDPDGHRLTYFWITPANSGVSVLSTANTPNPTFIAPSVNTQTIYTFYLVVNDGKLDSKPLL